MSGSAVTAPAISSSLRLRAVPGVWRPSTDARLLADLVVQRGLARGQDVLDVFTGTGVLALAAAQSGARSVSAIDLSRRALLTVRLNAWRNGLRVRTLRGDLFAPVEGERFDLILANPPYFPGGDRLPVHRAARAWEGGADGRVLVDRVCALATGYLRPGGRLLLVHNTLTGESGTLSALRRSGLQGEVVLRHRGPLGPIGREAAARTGGTTRPEDPEEIIVIMATRTREADQAGSG